MTKLSNLSKRTINRIDRAVFGPFSMMMGFATCAEPDWRLDLVTIVETVVRFVF